MFSLVYVKTVIVATGFQPSKVFSGDTAVTKLTIFGPERLGATKLILIVMGTN